MPMTVADHIAKHLDMSDPGVCWEWQGTNICGYGVLWLTVDGGRSSKQAHRAAYEHLVGPIPEGLHIDHLCRNRACCNPAHLEPVTQFENNRRRDGHLPRRSGRLS